MLGTPPCILGTPPHCPSPPPTPSLDSGYITHIAPTGASRRAIKRRIRYTFSLKTGALVLSAGALLEPPVTECIGIDRFFSFFFGMRLYAWGAFDNKTLAISGNRLTPARQSGFIIALGMRGPLLSLYAV